MPASPPVVLVGPTATGKTALAVAVARRLGDAELLNADSRQVLRGLQVGTCAPTAAELRGVPCHLLGLVEPGEPFSVADWVRAAAEALAGVQARGHQAILVGGTGLYVSALIDGFHLGAGRPDPRRRAQLTELAAQPSGLAALAAELSRRDPAGAATVDLRNPRRVVRALELVDAHGGLAAARGRGPGRPVVMVGLDAPRPLHHALIAERARRLLETGALLREVDSALARGISRAALDSAGIGYREALAVRDGTLTPQGGAEALAQRTRRYAKAQRTWFRRDPRIRWIERGAEPVEGLVDEVLDALHQDAWSGQRLHRRR